MKISYLISLIILSAFFFISCDKLNSTDEKKDANTIGGDTNIAEAQPGNEFSTSASIGDKYYNIGASAKVLKNENGVATMKLVADLSKVPELKKINDLIPASMKDSLGRISTEVQFKMTSEGIQDYFNKDHKAHTIVKYDCNVGDKYQLTKSDGKTITRTVTAKSTTDDFPYGFMNIKTITVEQDSRIPGVRKIIYRANHKFGLVHFEVVMEDGTSAKSYLYSKN